VGRPGGPWAIWLAGLGVLSATPAWAGPPFLTDDPEPTEKGRWEIYAPLLEADGTGGEFEGSAGVEINYGAARDVQVTLGLPVQIDRSPEGSEWGAGDVAVSVKYRFVHREDIGLSIAVFPGVTLPTARHGSGVVTAYLPVWFQKDSGPWTVFGGGGYAINPGDGNRNFATGALAVSRQVTPDLSLGVEAERQGSETVDGHPATRLGVAAIYRLAAPIRLLASAGPTFEDDGSETGFHAFLALGLDF